MAVGDSADTAAHGMEEGLAIQVPVSTRNLDLAQELGVSCFQEKNIYSPPSSLPEPRSSTVSFTPTCHERVVLIALGVHIYCPAFSHRFPHPCLGLGSEVLTTLAPKDTRSLAFARREQEKPLLTGPVVSLLCTALH